MTQERKQTQRILEMKMGDIITNSVEIEDVSWTILLQQMGKYNWTRGFPEKCNISKII